MNTNYNEEIKAYYKFVKEILEEYEIDYDNISFLQQSENVTFSIEEKNTEEKYLVRIHKSINKDDEYQNNKSMINSELLLLEALNKCDMFTVQTPLKNRYGNFVTQAYFELLDTDLYVTVLKWIDGEIIDINRKKYNGLAFKLGKEMARNHKYLNSWKAPKDFIRTEYDLETIKANIIKLTKLIDIGIISKMRFNAIYESAMMIIEFLEKNLSKRENWGLIHGDLNEGNYIINDKDIFFIDFSRCGFGYYLYDIAQTLMHLSTENRKIFIDGYKNIFTLPNDYEKLIESFFVLSIIDNMLFLSSDPGEYEHIGNIANYLCDYALNEYKHNKRFILGN